MPAMIYLVFAMDQGTMLTISHTFPYLIKEFTNIIPSL